MNTHFTGASIITQHQIFKGFVLILEDVKKLRKTRRQIAPEGGAEYVNITIQLSIAHIYDV